MPTDPTIRADGFAIVNGVLDRDDLDALEQALMPVVDGSSAAGVRGLAQKVPLVRALAEAASVRALVESELGADAMLVRSILFNKGPLANWQVPWHQDLAIAVLAQADVDGYSGWSVKDDVHHVQPPVAILERMLTIRLHLDATNATNGALWVAPGSHRLGRLAAADAATVAERLGPRLCRVEAGGALLFKPLLLHASRKANPGLQRRVVHLEFANVTLPEPLKWAEERPRQVVGSG